MEKIKEIIVVEGKDDTTAIRRSVHADTIETNGSAISNETLEEIRHAANKRGVIVFTDPDYPGNKIRRTIERYVPQVKHAYLLPESCQKKNSHKVGIEYASSQAIQEALRCVKTVYDQPISDITIADLSQLGLTGGQDSSPKRAFISKKLHIGHVNSKQLLKRLQMYHISKEELIATLATYEQEERE